MRKLSWLTWYLVLVRFTQIGISVRQKRLIHSVGTRVHCSAHGCDSLLAERQLPFTIRISCGSQDPLQQAGSMFACGPLLKVSASSSHGKQRESRTCRISDDCVMSCSEFFTIACDGAACMCDDQHAIITWPRKAVPTAGAVRLQRTSTMRITLLARAPRRSRSSLLIAASFRVATRSHHFWSSASTLSATNFVSCTGAHQWTSEPLGDANAELCKASCRHQAYGDKHYLALTLRGQQQVQQLVFGFDLRRYQPCWGSSPR